jgi:hypothetical protein
MTMLLVLTLTACGAALPLKDQAVQLRAGEGLAAVMLDTLDPLVEVSLESSTPRGFKFGISSIPAGRNLYLLQVPAGEYCFTRVQYGGWYLYSNEQTLGCFEVKAGELGYSGTLALRAEGGKIVSHQVDDPAGFRALLAERYPMIARQFQLTAAR